MGSSKSKFSALTEQILEEYSILTYLSKAEILHIYKVFGQLDPQGILQDINVRFPCNYVQDIFTQLKYNPFRDRIFKVFSSEKDGHMSFEDILDLCSVMSEKCPEAVKAAWAFRIFDFDEDNYIGVEDLAMVIHRLTRVAQPGYITVPEQDHIIKVLMQEMDIENSAYSALVLFSATSATAAPSSKQYSATFLPHPSNCSFYIVCYRNICYEMPCPAGTEFSTSLKKCVHIWQAGCIRDSERNTTVSPENTTPGQSENVTTVTSDSATPVVEDDTTTVSPDCTTSVAEILTTTVLPEDSTTDLPPEGSTSDLSPEGDYEEGSGVAGDDEVDEVASSSGDGGDHEPVEDDGEQSGEQGGSGQEPEDNNDDAGEEDNDFPNGGSDNDDGASIEDDESVNDDVAQSEEQTEKDEEEDHGVDEDNDLTEEDEKEDEPVLTPQEICAADPRRFFYSKHPYDCTYYVICNFGQAIERQCPATEYFNPSITTCVRNTGQCLQAIAMYHFH